MSMLCNFNSIVFYTCFDTALQACICYIFHYFLNSWVLDSWVSVKTVNYIVFLVGGAIHIINNGIMHIISVIISILSSFFLHII